MKVAIQGIKGSFHEAAALKFHPQKTIDILECNTFRQLTDAVVSGEADSALMAIENTVAGSILPNYDLLQSSSLKIEGEVFLRIEQNLMVNSGVKLSDIKTVYSHPMALYQCSDFFSEQAGIELIEAVDTAKSAKELSVSGSSTKAAIASRLAAETYHLNIIAPGIENNKQNYTRFFVVKKKQNLVRPKRAINKSSVYFSLPHTTGSLSGVLSVFALYGINLQKIQSHPIVGTPWKYMFYIDLIFEDSTRYKQSMEAVKPLTENFEVMGEYCEGEKVFLPEAEMQLN